MPTTMLIPLTQGKFAVIDEADYELVSGHKWFAHKPHQRPSWYANANIRRDGRWGIIRMHRVIMDAPAGMEVDHRDGDGLNNTRANLRLATKSQNMANRGAPRANKTGLKGAFPCGKGWMSRIRHQGKQIYIGFYATPEEAHAAYAAKAREIHGEFARTE